MCSCNQLAVCVSPAHLTRSCSWVQAVCVFLRVGSAGSCCMWLMLVQVVLHCSFIACVACHLFKARRELSCNSCASIACSGRLGSHCISFCADIGSSLQAHSSHAAGELICLLNGGMCIRFLFQGWSSCAAQMTVHCSAIYKPSSPTAVVALEAVASHASGSLGKSL